MPGIHGDITVMGQRPLLHVYPPFEKDGKWYGAMVIFVGDEPVKIMASANESLLQAAYNLASKYVSPFVTYGKDSPHVGGHHRTLRDRLKDLSPYFPEEGLTPLQQQCLRTLRGAASGCEACVDAIVQVEEDQTNPKHRRIKSAMNMLLNEAMRRRQVVSSVIGMTPGEFASFLRRVQA